MAGVLSWFLLAMVLNPEVQKKAQAELDAVVGRNRVPSFADWDHLPYIRAIVKEAIRWHPVDPLGKPDPAPHSMHHGLIHLKGYNTDRPRWEPSGAGFFRG